MSKRTRSRRSGERQSYREPLYDSDYESLSETASRPSRHSARLRAAYDDLSTSDSDASQNELPPPVRRVRAPRPVKRKTRSATTIQKENVFQDFKSKKVAAVVQRVKAVPRSAARTSSHRVATRGIIPPWQTLEYQILLKIMKYAAYPLYTDTSHDAGSTAWLLKVSTLSRSFHEAALGALLHSPPLLPSYRAHSLVKLLKTSKQEFGDDMNVPRQKESSILSTDYRRMIQHLSIDAKNILASKPTVQIGDILSHTLVLKSLSFYHNHDAVVNKAIWAHPNHSQAKNRWQYTQLYPVLAHLPHRLALRHFEWNARFLTHDDALLDKFSEFHNSASAFEGLKSVTLRNFIIDDVEKLSETLKLAAVIADPEFKPTAPQNRLLTWRQGIKAALSTYKQLKELSICNCNIFDNASIASLPPGLERLEIEACPIISSEGLQAYLSSGGRHMKELVLKGNQYMSLEFMALLKEYTPKLQVLDVDLTYRDPTSYRDTEPLFDSLLSKGPPSWPEDLERISVGPLRKLSTEDAVNFYQSLIDSAGQLKYLRVLELRTLLNEAGWRDRAALRAKWIVKFQEVFDIKYNPRIKPPSDVTCLPWPKVEVLIKVKVKRTKNQEIQEPEFSRSSRTPMRKSQRIQELVSSDSQGQLSDSTPDPPSPTYSSLLEVFDEDSFVRQGRCHTVTFELSDQRPAQEQFREEDFLDSEADLDKDGNYHQ